MLISCLFPLLHPLTPARASSPSFKVIAFYPEKTEQAHISFVREANPWFTRMAAQGGFSYIATTNWADLNDQVLAQYQVVVFLDTRPEAPEQRQAFQRFMEKGGAWMGFHFAGFALTPSGVPQNWDWYHNNFLGAGSYVGNTWRPTSAVLRVEDTRASRHPSLALDLQVLRPMNGTNGVNDLRTNSSIKILLSIDPASFPSGHRARNLTRSGTRVTIPWFGRISVTG